jgi:hypothetical protein
MSGLTQPPFLFHPLQRRCVHINDSIMTVHPLTDAEQELSSHYRASWIKISFTTSSPGTKHLFETTQRSLFRRLCQTRQDKFPESSSIRIISRFLIPCWWMVLTEQHCRDQNAVPWHSLQVTGHLPMTQESESSAGFYSWPGHCLYLHILRFYSLMMDMVSANLLIYQGSPFLGQVKTHIYMKI